MLDITSLLDDNDIEYQTSGKNVTSGWIEIHCPFCEDEGYVDPSFHLGVNISSGLFNCWICEKKGGLEFLVKKLLDISYGEAKKLVKKYRVDFVEDIKEEIKEKSIITSVKFPKGVEKTFPELHRNYLIKRNFNPEHLVEKYKLRACYRLGGKFAYRIIIPILVDGVMVSYTARDVTDKQEHRYETLSNELSLINAKDCLYGLDSIRKGGKAIIVEGVFDKWRIGEDCCATLGTKYTPKQLHLLYEKKLSHAYVMFDPDAAKKAIKFGHILSTFIKKVEVLELEQGDPAEISDEEVKTLRKELNL